ncbi:MAG: hypothetical protein ACLU2X_12455, partial [Ruminococcus sp.]
MKLIISIVTKQQKFVKQVARKPLLQISPDKRKKPEYSDFFLKYGSPSWTRTNDPAVNSRMLY